MCGILAVVRKAGGPLDISACRRALSSLSWRGPDFCMSAVWYDRVFLGQTVLSLTGAIEDDGGSHARAASGRYIVSFNGEIYNYKELAARWLHDRTNFSASTTDTNVLANLHDVMGAIDIPAQLDGMYAYCVLDEQEQTLSLCRDIQGEKSLYIFEDTETIIIASEIPAILSLVPSTPLDTQVLRDYFRTRHFMQFSRTAYRGIRQLLPGQLALLDLRTMRWGVGVDRPLSSWIDPNRLEVNSRRSLDSLADELDALLSRSAREMLPDRRPYAVVVSGGVDSSLLAHYLVTQGAPDMLVAVDHVGKDRISADLSGFERVLKRKIDVLHINQVPYSAEIVRCQHTCGSPLLSHSFVPQSLQSAQVRSAGCRAIFGGEGGDELFGGYDAYLREICTTSRYSPSPYTAHEEPQIEFEHDEPQEIQADLADAWARSLDAYACVEDRQERVKLAMMYADTAYQLPAVGLRGADLMSMMWSVEARSLLMRKPIVQFALNLPLSARLDPVASDNNLRTKVLLKRLFLRYYPTNLLQEKQGFGGFPNESAAYLGDRSDYLLYATLGTRRPSVATAAFSQSTLWKLANVEYFLRSRVS